MTPQQRPDGDDSTAIGETAEDDHPSKRTRGQKFHEATGSLRDLGISILLLILLFIIVYFVFLR